jgi:hypothetical protein
VQVLGPDGVSPVAGASMVWTSSPVAGLSACGGAAGCTLLSDQNGQVSTRVTVRSASPITITAQLAPATYSPAKQVQATVPVIAAASAISLFPTFAWVAQDATAELPVVAKVLANGAPALGVPLSFQVLGKASVSATSTVTDSAGSAAVTVHLAGLLEEADVIVCTADNSACKTLKIFPVAPSAFRVLPVAGTLQVVSDGKAFQPVVVRVIDSGTGNPVRGAAVLFNAIIGRAVNDTPVLWIGDNGITRNPMPVILGSVQLTAQSDSEGLATIQPPVAEFPGPLLVLGSASTGAGSLSFELQSLPQVAGQEATRTQLEGGTSPPPASPSYTLPTAKRPKSPITSLSTRPPSR